jgi:hypothetical protein
MPAFSPDDRMRRCLSILFALQLAAGSLLLALTVRSYLVADAFQLSNPTAELMISRGTFIILWDWWTPCPDDLIPRQLVPGMPARTARVHWTREQSYSATKRYAGARWRVWFWGFADSGPSPYRMTLLPIWPAELLLCATTAVTYKMRRRMRASGSGFEVARRANNSGPQDQRG